MNYMQQEVLGADICVQEFNKKKKKRRRKSKVLVKEKNGVVEPSREGTT
jgi:hypothetical protein